MRKLAGLQPREFAIAQARGVAASRKLASFHDAARLQALKPASLRRPDLASSQTGEVASLQSYW